MTIRMQVRSVKHESALPSQGPSRGTYQNLRVRTAAVELAVQCHARTATFPASERFGVTSSTAERRPYHPVIALKNSSQSRTPYTILSHRPSGNASGEASARTQRES